VGAALSMVTSYYLAQQKAAPDGALPFCRSLGRPAIEEVMFSYCWKVCPNEVRTVAKALSSAGVGVWIDVVKLCPGDEIRPLLRSVVKSVQRVVVFLSKEYAQSQNCCVGTYAR
jgi:hypothetical protein